jgi:hypothetical protein
LGLRLLPQVQPVKAGTTDPESSVVVVVVVVVVVGGTGPVNETTNVRCDEPLFW